MSQMRELARRGLPFAVSAFALTSPCNAQIPTPDSLRKVLAQATYVFQGTVRKWNAAADTALAPTERRAIVNVTRAFACPAAVGEFEKEDVTIRYENPSYAPAGTSGWFLGTGWVVGEHIATTVVSLVPTKSKVQNDSMTNNLLIAIRLSAREALRATANAADKIVIATIRQVGPTRTSNHEPRSEHIERWNSVNLAVDSERVFRVDTTRKGERGGAAWVPPRSGRNLTILVPSDVLADTSGATIVVGARLLLLLDNAARRPNLHNVDPSATAFIPNRTGLRAMGDTVYLGPTLPNPQLGIQPVHACATPFK